MTYLPVLNFYDFFTKYRKYILLAKIKIYMELEVSEFLFEKIKICEKV